MYKLLLYIFFILLSASAYGIKELNVKLDKSEKDWINANKSKKISIYLDEDRGILNYYLKDQMKGMFPYVIKVLKKNTGLNFQIVNEETEIFEKSVDDGIPDIVMGVEDYKRNSKIYHYIDKPIELDGVMITRKDYPLIDFREDNSGKIIAYEKGDQIKNKIPKKYRDQIKFISKPNQEEAIKAILSKEADIYIEDYQEALKYLIKNPNDGVKINYLSSALKTDYYIGGKEEFKPLISIVNKILQEMNLTVKFFHSESLDYVRDKLEISKQLEKYIENKKVIKVLIPSFEEFPQLYYTNKEKEAEGFLKNYFFEIDRILGMEIEFKKEGKDSEIDINPFVLSVNGNELIAQDQKILITEPYVQIPLLIFNRKEQNYVPYFDKLKKYTIGVVKNSFIEKYLVYKGLENNLIRFERTQDVIKALSSKKVDLLVGELQQINYFSNLNSIKNLQVAGIVQDKLELSFGISKKEETLYFLINSIDSDFAYRITKDRKEFFSKKIELAKDYKLSLFITLISIILLSIIYNHLRKVKKISVKLKKLTIGLVETLENANTFNDEDTGAHIKRISKYSKFLAKELQLKHFFIEKIELYASLHDVGKIGIPDNILKKPGKLTEEEFETMKNHVEIGYNLMRDLDISPVALNVIRYHHEKWNGMGYGKGLKGKEIPIEARIVALADVYDALRQERVYKKAFTHEKSMAIIISESGKHFDPKIVEVFEKRNKIFEDIFEENSN